ASGCARILGLDLDGYHAKTGDSDASRDAPGPADTGEPEESDEATPIADAREASSSDEAARDVASDEGDARAIDGTKEADAGRSARSCGARVSATSIRKWAPLSQPIRRAMYFWPEP